MIHISEPGFPTVTVCGRDLDENNEQEKIQESVHGSTCPYCRLMRGLD